MKYDPRSFLESNPGNPAHSLVSRLTELSELPVSTQYRKYTRFFTKSLGNRGWVNMAVGLILVSKQPSTWNSKGKMFVNICA
jgi:hypothetical protein